MLDINLIRKQPDLIKKSLKDRGLKPSLADDFLALDEEWRNITKVTDEARAKLNAASKERNIEEGKRLKNEIKKLEDDIKIFEKKREELLCQFPNIPAPDAPVGKDASENVVLRTWGKGREDGTDYLALAEKLDLIDIKSAGKVSGSRFGYLKRELARLELALVQFVFHEAIKEGFIPVIPPVMLKPEMLKAMGKIKFIEDKDAFYLPDDDLYLAGSAEHTIGPMHAGEVFEEKDLPRRYIGFSTCFRREAGSYGKDTRGILRVHQFDKAELFSFVRPEDSENEHQFLVSFQERLMQALGLPYQVVAICTGDMGFGDARQYDIETWIPSEGKYRETQSASNTTDYQARGLNIKYKLATRDSPRSSFGGAGMGHETKFVHMLNATGFAIGRTLIAILENYQTAQETVKIPEALVKYAGFGEITR